MGVDASAKDARVQASAAEWIESGKGAAGAAQTTTHAAETGKTHYLVHVWVSYDAAVAGSLVQIKDGTTVIYEGYVHNSRELNFGAPLKMTEGNKIDVVAAGATGAIAAVSFSGFTV